MKYYAKFMLLAIVLSIVLYGGRVYRSFDDLSIQHYIVYNHCGELVKFTAAQMVIYLRNLFPYYIYIVIFSTYIYGHFCYSSVYIFSRCQKRGWWFRKEAAELFVYTFIYVILLNISALPIVSMRYHINIDYIGIRFLIIHMFVVTFWLYGITLLANIVSSLLGSKVTIVGTFLIQALLFLSVGNISVGKTIITKTLRWRFYKNYNMQMLPALHDFEGKNENIINELGIGIKYHWSILYMFVVNLFIIIIGTVIIDRIDIIDDNREID